MLDTALIMPSDAIIGNGMPVVRLPDRTNVFFM
jgi:hypothetical protein